MIAKSGYVAFSDHYPLTYNSALPALTGFPR